MKIASWNVNSIRARLPNVLDWLKQAAPEVALLQEIKSQEETFPREQIEDLGYNVAIVGQKSYNGVAALSKFPMDVALTALPGDETDEQARYIEIETEGVRAACIYLPNGNPVDSDKFPYKLEWMARLNQHAANLLALEEPIVLAGDYNLIPKDEDVHDPAGWRGDALFRPESQRYFRELTNLGYVDAFRALHAEPGSYTFWDYQAGAWQKDHGIRIDHLMLSPQAADRLEACEIDRDPRGKEKASDHTPIWCALSQ